MSRSTTLTPWSDVLQRGRQDLAVEAQLLPGLVEHRDHFAHVHARAAQRAGQHQPRRGRADRRGQQALGELHPARGRPLRRAAARGPSAAACSSNARRAWRSPTMRSASASRSPTRTLPAPAAGGRARCALRRRDRGTARRAGARRKRGRQRTDTNRNTPTLSSSDQNVPWVSGSQPCRPNNCSRPQPVDAERAVLEPAAAEPAGVASASAAAACRPTDAKPSEQAGLDARAAGAAPVQAADQRRRELRHRRERHQPVGGERGVAAAERGSSRTPSPPADDGDAADPQHRRGDVAALALRPAARAAAAA